MKTLSGSIILILISLSLSAQHVTEISGKMTNYYGRGDKVKLELIRLDSLKLTEEKSYVETELAEDGSFAISTLEVLKPNTLAFLHFARSRKTKLYLTPGDSLFIQFDYQYFENSIHYSGIGSEKNNYLAQYYLRFEYQNPKYSAFRSNPSDFVRKLTEFRNRELTLLGDFVHTETVDSLFHAFEINRIEYQYLADLLSISRLRIKEDPDTKKLITEKAEDVDRNDVTALLTNRDYRNFIKKYVGFQALLNEAGANEVPEKVAIANEQLGELSKRFYLVSLYLESKNKTYRLPIEREIVLDYILTNSNDQEFETIINNYHKDKHPGRIYFSRDLGEGGGAMAAILIGLLVFGFLLIKVTQWASKIKMRFNYVAWLRYILLLLIMAAAGMYILTTFRHYKILSVLYVAMMFAFLAIHTYFLIPTFINKKRFLPYGLLAIFLSVVYIIVQFKIVSAKIIMYPNFYTGNQGGIDRDVVTFLFTSIPLMILLSFLYYYMSLLAKEQKGFSHLIREKWVDREVLIHTLIVSIFCLPVLAAIGPNLKINFLVLFLLGVGVFYLQTFILIPQFAFKKKILSYLIYNIALVLGIVVILMLTDTIQSYINIRDRGIAISMTSLFRFKDTIDLPLALTSLWLIIPAGIYAATRNQIKKQKDQGFKLFRKKEAELNQLRSQVNPHFLFNTLNTLYAFALKEKSDQTAECIAKLANLMRFLIDDMEKDTIPVKTEIGYIEDFIALQSIRSAAKHKIEVNSSIDEDAEYAIAPMLLIPFIENAFKHGLNPNKKSELKFDVKAKDKQMQFVIENSVDENFEAFYKEKGFGIGINNVRKRLELIYPGKHNLSIAQTHDRFIVILKIDLTHAQFTSN